LRTASTSSSSRAGSAAAGVELEGRDSAGFLDVERITCETGAAPTDVLFVETIC
jgi:hypothetical protein